MKVIFFNSCTKWGGGEKWHSEMAKAILGQNNIEVVAFANPLSKLFQEFQNSKISTIGISITSLSFLNVFKYFKLKATIKKLKADAIILNLSADVKFGARAAKAAGIKNIIYRRGSAIPIRNTWLNRHLFSKVLTHVLVNSEETKRTILANNATLFNTEKIHIIYNGIDPNSFDTKHATPLYKKQGNEVVIGNLARLSKQKGQNYLVQLAKKLKEKGYNFKILIGGIGELENELKELVKNEDLQDVVMFCGFISNPSEFYRSIDILAFPSIWEGFGFTIVEAKLHGIPVVAFNISSNPEVIRHKTDGFLAASFKMTEYQNYIETLINEPELRKEMGIKGREDVLERFTHERSKMNFLEYLQSL